MSFLDPRWPRSLVEVIGCSLRIAALGSAEQSQADKDNDVAGLASGTAIRKRSVVGRGGKVDSVVWAKPDLVAQTHPKLPVFAGS